MKNEILTDKCFNNISRLVQMCIEENHAQIKKWGIQKHSSFEWLTYTTEELGELAEAISEYEYRNGHKDNIVFEAIQVATLSLKIAEMYLSD